MMMSGHECLMKRANPARRVAVFFIEEGKPLRDAAAAEMTLMSDLLVTLRRGDDRLDSYWKRRTCAEGGGGDSFAELKSWCVTREFADVARLTIRIVVVQLADGNGTWRRDLDVIAGAFLGQPRFASFLCSALQEDHSNFLPNVKLPNRPYTLPQKAFIQKLHTQNCRGTAKKVEVPALHYPGRTASTDE